MTRETCTRCLVSYAPDLTGQRCPVCDAPAPGAPADDAPARDRLMTIVVLAAALNVTLMLAVAVAVARAA